jgi:[protein-PII] uridylyltransferase
VSFDNEAAAEASVIEIEGADRPGLLFDIARAIHQQRLSISSAIIATYGERAVDVFYVRDEFGHKVTNVERIASVEKRLLQLLTDSP